jgi:hypothetical protein
MSDPKLTVRVCSYRTPQRYVLLRMVWAALAQLRSRYPDVQVEIEQVCEVEQILRYTPVLVSVSLVIQQRLVCTGRQPSKEEVLAWLEAAIVEEKSKTSISDVVLQ